MPDSPIQSSHDRSTYMASIKPLEEASRVQRQNPAPLLGACPIASLFGRGDNFNGGHGEEAGAKSK
jgi:hypothetical protein